MNENILAIKDKVLKDDIVTKDMILQCQNAVNSAIDLYMTYWLMARYYLNRNELDALTYCILKCYELNEIHHFDLEFKVKDFMEARCEFMEEAISKTRTRILPLSILFGVIALVLIWLIMSNGEFTGFLLGFLAMNLISIGFQKTGMKKTIESFKKKQYAAVYGYLDENDQKFADKN